MFNLSLFNQTTKIDDTIILTKEVQLHKSDVLNKFLNLVFTKTIDIGYIRNKIKDYGSFIIIINSQKNEGPSAIYCISKSSRLSKSNISKLSHSDGIYGDSIELEWNPGEYPLLKYTYKYVYNLEETSNCKVDFLIKII